MITMEQQKPMTNMNQSNEGHSIWGSYVCARTWECMCFYRALLFLPFPSYSKVLHF